jgi:DNA polymerase III sliding clamp (beta) subunit (PCNA family)
VGEFHEELGAEYQGKELGLGFNPVYLMDVLKNLNDESVGLELIDGEKPELSGLPVYIYIVLPMRIN